MVDEGAAEGRTSVVVAPAIRNKSVPTVTDLLTAATPLEIILVGRPHANAPVDNSKTRIGHILKRPNPRKLPPPPTATHPNNRPTVAPLTLALNIPRLKINDPNHRTPPPRRTTRTEDRPLGAGVGIDRRPTEESHGGGQLDGRVE